MNAPELDGMTEQEGAAGRFEAQIFGALPVSDEAANRRLHDRLAHGFRRSVLAHLPDIGYGQTESYAQVATATGSPRAVRAVGTACALNPLPVVVPCHRVIRSDGSSGQYAGGAAAKEMLLHLEGAA